MRTELYFPRGAPEYFRKNPRVVSIRNEFYNSGMYVIANCHGVQILAIAGLINNRKIACNERVKFEVESCGGTCFFPSLSRQTA